ncbi:transmembrane sensor [Parabacteroides sp. PF5-5]|uniref:FecR family protein n=1 Tax=unclassified Parabacteroides TaxID=2649774 RepID=UPI002476D873|nr:MULTISPECIES: FecR family protein [unclassified Parabacteroides]MDH6305815.1 transmembrane sensor [Parabacteroides sp. PH5-39]MDH6317748.1 transmembrane sensor [Parabacteroides sp. PF5-13]MDH6320579.1 transmembrane sensor [Parabacteroides sp. PH5-13]MDH6324258.1 transmembrane sensor [Parabacteroides sp. PH5-8]MDH6328933.1 transmembrane sensor [Parabacteroides sp. PH5-41]
MENKNTYKESEIDNLIISYFTEKLGKREVDLLREWVQRSDENKKYFNNLQEIWIASLDPDKSKEYDKDDAYERFLLRITNNETTIKDKKTRLLRLLLYGVASVIFILLISYASYWQGSEHLKSQFADVVIEAPLGSKTKMYLPDGTLVWLNADSKITYSQGFGVNNRKIHLVGEGYFEVTNNEKLPFLVRTDELHTDVIGTKFNIRNYPEEEEASVSLLEGKVLVKNTLKNNDKVCLSPDQKVFLNKKSGEMRVSKVNARYTMEWTNGYLFFDEELLVDIAKELERSYNVKIVLLDKSLESFRFYGNFIRREQTIDEIMILLESTGKIKYEKDGRNIKLSSK